MTDVSDRARALADDIAKRGPEGLRGVNRDELVQKLRLFERDILAGQSVPEGYVLVPREPTEAMLKAGRPAHDDYLTAKGTYPRTRAVWSAMLAAIPKGGE